MAEARQPFWRTLYFWVLVAIALGIATGWAFPAFGQSLEPIGIAFRFRLGVWFENVHCSQVGRG